MLFCPLTCMYLRRTRKTYITCRTYVWYNIIQCNSVCVCIQASSWSTSPGSFIETSRLRHLSQQKSWMDLEIGWFSPSNMEILIGKSSRNSSFDGRISYTWADFPLPGYLENHWSTHVKILILQCYWVFLGSWKIGPAIPPGVNYAFLLPSEWKADFSPAIHAMPISLSMSTSPQTLNVFLKTNDDVRLGDLGVPPANLRFEVQDRYEKGIRVMCFLTRNPHQVVWRYYCWCSTLFKCKDIAMVWHFNSLHLQGRNCQKH